MRRLVLLSLLVLLSVNCSMHVNAAGKITTDPNARSSGSVASQANSSEPAVDDRISQKISYEANRKMLSEVVADLSKLTGIKFTCGRSNMDWRAQEIKIDVFAKDITVSNLMDITAHAAKCEWSRYPDRDKWAYCINEDQSSEEQMQIRANMLTDEDTVYRRNYIQQLNNLDTLSTSNIAKLKQENPCLYLLKSSGTVKSIKSFLGDAPEVTEAWIKGEELSITTDTISNSGQQTYDSILFTAKQLYKLMSLPGEQASTQSAGTSNVLIKVDKPIGSEKFGRITISELPLLIFDPRDAAAKIRGRIVLAAAEQQRPIKEIYQEMKTEYTQALGARLNQPAEVDYLEEPLMDHPTDSTLLQKIKLDVQGNKFEDFASALAKASGTSLAIGYTSSLSMYIRSVNWKSIIDTSQEVELKTVLDKITEITHCNWQKKEAGIEFLDRKWIRNRAARVPESWLRRWRGEASSTGTLSLETMIDIAALQDAQRQTVLNDDVLAAVSPDAKESLSDIVNNNLDLLRLYNMLEHDQRKALFDSSGLNIKAMTQDQQKAIQSMAAADTLQQAGQFILYATKQPQDKQTQYSFVARSSSGTMLAQWKFISPQYPGASK